MESHVKCPAITRIPEPPLSVSRPQASTRSESVEKRDWSPDPATLVRKWVVEWECSQFTEWIRGLRLASKSTTRAHLWGGGSICSAAGVTRWPSIFSEKLGFFAHHLSGPWHDLKRGCITSDRVRCVISLNTMYCTVASSTRMGEFLPLSFERGALGRFGS